VTWAAYFRTLPPDPFSANPRVGPSHRARGLFTPGPASSSATAIGADAETARALYLQDRVDQLIRAYRVRGHLIAKFDPLEQPRPPHPELGLEYHGLGEEQLDQVFSSHTLSGCPDHTTLRDILSHLHNTYCRSIGVQYMHIDDVHIKTWLQQRMESTQNRVVLSRDEQFRILTKLTDAVIFEEFIHKKYIGAKRFSLEGGESLIPLLDMAIERAGAHGVSECVLAMAHRGRLNVLANIMDKSPRQIFWEFEDSDPERYRGSGDVKYHAGHSCDRMTASGHRVHLSLCFNPSHLEFVNPVAVGRMRAKLDRARRAGTPKEGMVILMHGDAAFAGQGINQEVLNLSELTAYATGGTLHIITNNQLGFTTSPAEGRSTPYSSTVARMLQVPIFLVNGEDPEAVAQVLQVAMDFRQAFRRDVVIDMYCYRRYGHNEADEPSFTQPLLYDLIRRRESVREGYLRHLLALGGITRDEADELIERRRAELEKELTVARSGEYSPAPDTLGGHWKGYRGGSESEAPEVPTGVARDTLVSILRSLTTFPKDFRPHPKLDRFFAHRKEMADGTRPVDWASAEALALGSIALEGTCVRFAGQDSARGTFSQRHATLHDIETGKTYTPLAKLSTKQAALEVINSPLSEIGVVGFEYGYSLDYPDSLVVWEAQFGDFANVAQVIIDQFIVSAELKWARLSGLVLILPHGFEGQGPEHSSARLERFLQMAAEDNIQIVAPTTPAQVFHVLRRQTVRKWRKPLIMLTPKNLFRHESVVSPLEDLVYGSFQRVLPDEGGPVPSRTRRILLCSGKIYYELEAWRRTKQVDDVAILRVEQFYPLPDPILEEVFRPYLDGTDVTWVQEETENDGAWHHWCLRFGQRFLGRFPLSVVCREASASPSTGSYAAHKMEEAQLVAAAFAPRKSLSVVTV
jgi:2-oxoglutarate dehydrogenase E1 component